MPLRCLPPSIHIADMFIGLTRPVMTLNSWCVRLAPLFEMFRSMPPSWSARDSNHEMMPVLPRSLMCHSRLTPGANSMRDTDSSFGLDSRRRSQPATYVRQVYIREQDTRQTWPWPRAVLGAWCASTLASTCQSLPALGHGVVADFACYEALALLWTSLNDASSTLLDHARILSPPQAFVRPRPIFTPSYPT